MKIYSEITGKEYKTVEDCKKDEEIVAVQKAAEQAKADKLAAERKQRAAKVEEAYKKIIDDRKQYRKLVDEFIQDYGSFHMTVKDNNPMFDDTDFVNLFKYAFSW